MDKNTVFTPRTEEEIIKIIEFAKSTQCSLHCFSGGFNWGYGVNAPIDSVSVQLNLAHMNKIISFDEPLGILKIEPGVTQGQLEEYLILNNYQYYVPNNGAGKRASLVGNALERGFGIAPIQDHASSILSVRGVLSDGSVYESALREVDSKLADCFSWGIGPQIDKLVTQSSWIIVTEMSIQLKRKHECTDVLLLPFSEKKLSQVMEMLRSLMSYDEVNLGSIKIFNRKQVIEVKETFMDKTFFSQDEWFMTIIIYSNSVTRSAVLKLLKMRIRNFIKGKISILNESRINKIISLLKLLPDKISLNPISKLNDLNQMLRLAQGFTSEVGYRALDIGFDYLNTKQFDFDKFDKNLIWLSPICPLEPSRAMELINLLRKMNTHPQFKFNTFTWTVLNQRTLAMVIPILYEKNNTNTQDDFWSWYKTVHLELKNNGFIPYRFHNNMMDFLREELLPKYFTHVKKIEGAMDPNSLILQGRYFKRVSSSAMNRMVS